ncbi:conserved hypothetical protein [Neospora caninum Liverpool]|uniref:Cullin family profile domain-containing protein n=1 Tax=Neospora caninum (strain Liverpool) TaxID=572307 RepID=F0VIW4_NEOCL|nr:conserved hypothetical protein [Neospora caninum Liverpool]CBZ53675.1 conserved hypothetical protein [Neospora caninum Liverpool]CEL67665.1 TPA: hypothetical protein BN1204_034570 [Neospora caninum Liverpool]|eukprot:XP_003883707.1 conserved hypothetical protein [Neospora caninum Liverpool]
MESIVAASDALLSRGNSPVVHHLFAAWREALSFQGDSEKRLFLLYVLNDALQKCVSRRCPCILQLALDPLRAFCVQASRRPASNLDASARVFKILKVRRVFGNNESGDAICAAFLALLRGESTIALPAVDPEMLQPQPPFLPTDAKAASTCLPAPPSSVPSSSFPSALASLPAVIDTFSLQYPSKNDEPVAEHVDRLFAEEPGETTFRETLKEILHAVLSIQSTVADKDLARQKQEHHLAQLSRQQKLLEDQQRQKRVKFAKCGVLPEDETAEFAGLAGDRETDEAAQRRLKTQIKATQAKVKLLMELEWNQRIALQERLVNLAEMVEGRMEEVLARHVRCREVKTVLDRALHIATRRQQASKPVLTQDASSSFSTPPSSLSSAAGVSREPSAGSQADACALSAGRAEKGSESVDPEADAGRASEAM